MIPSVHAGLAGALPSGAARAKRNAYARGTREISVG
jgi:hypothetical protein